MLQETIKRARKEAKQHKNEPAKYYLCCWDGRVPGVGDRPPVNFTSWDVLTEEQHGFRVASERIPLYSEEVTETKTIEWWRE